MRDAFSFLLSLSASLSLSLASTSTLWQLKEKKIHGLWYSTVIVRVCVSFMNGGKCRELKEPETYLPYSRAGSKPKQLGLSNFMESARVDGVWDHRHDGTWRDWRGFLVQGSQTMALQDHLWKANELRVRLQQSSTLKSLKTSTFNWIFMFFNSENLEDRRVLFKAPCPHVRPPRQELSPFRLAFIWRSFVAGRYSKCIIYLFFFRKNFAIGQVRAPER